MTLKKRRDKITHRSRAPEPRSSEWRLGQTLSNLAMTQAPGADGVWELEDAKRWRRDDVDRAVFGA